MATDQPAWNGRTVSANVVGNYPGYQNDLDGPVPDAISFREAVLQRWPDMTFRNFYDNKATGNRLLYEIEEGAKQVGEDGMLFFIVDICHAESATRNGNLKAMRKRIMRDIGHDRVLVFSAAMSSEYASDAVFNNKPNGAWHYCLIKTLEKGITYIEWFNRAVSLLKKLGFKQTPVIEGPIELQNRLVFEGNVDTIEISGHGGQADDDDGDESDGKDEIIWMYDRGIRDDEIRKILNKMNMRIFAKNKLISIKMKAKSFKSRDWKDTWLQTALSIVALVFTVLVSFGVLTPEQMTEAQPLVNSTLGGVAAVIAGVSALIGIFAKQDAPIE